MAMGQVSGSSYTWIDFVFSVIGVFTFLVDWGADVWVATEFYSRGDLCWFGVLVGLMVLSSVLVQMFSWFWLRYDRDLPDLCRLFGDRVKLSCLLHVLQLGFLCRYDPAQVNPLSSGFWVPLGGALRGGGGVTVVTSPLLCPPPPTGTSGPSVRASGCGGAARRVLSTPCT